MSRKVMTTAGASSDREHIHVGFVIAWNFCAAFYFRQYMLRSLPAVMVPELTIARAWCRSAG
jgi:hypothetical protein